MTNISNDIDLLRIDEEAFSDYPINRPRFLLNTSFPFHLIPIKSYDSLNVMARPNPKLKNGSKKKNSSRNFYPTSRSRSQSSTNSPLTFSEQEKYRHHHHRRRHHHSDHNNSPNQQVQPFHGCDMRLFIIRHGERVDRVFGSNWFALAFDQLGQYRPYHINLPDNLPNRLNKYLWSLDTPLTRDGLNAAQNVGQVLKINHFEPSYVYSSPAVRCILTAHQILKGLGLEKKIAIRIEPGLLELGAARFGMSIFLKPIEWHNYGLNIDLSYKPIITDVPPMEREDAYYLRSKYIIREIEKQHNNLTALINILIVAHATSPETLTWDLVGRKPNFYDLFALSLNIGYLQMVIAERARQNKLWSFTKMPLQSTTLKWV